MVTKFMHLRGCAAEIKIVEFMHLHEIRKSEIIRNNSEKLWLVRLAKYKKKCISVSSDRRETKHGSLESSRNDDSYGGGFASLESMGAEIFDETSTKNNYSFIWWNGVVQGISGNFFKLLTI